MTLSALKHCQCKLFPHLGQCLKRILSVCFQMHPLGLCNNNDEEDLYEYGWVGVVKLEQPELDPSCLTVLGKVKKKKKDLFSDPAPMKPATLKCGGICILSGCRIANHTFCRPRQVG